MKILFISEYYPPHIGGQELLFENLVNGISSKNIYCTVITSKTNKNSQAFETADNKTIYRLNIPIVFFRFFFSIASIIKCLKLRKEFDLIHGSTYGGALPSFILSKLLNKPSILTVHEFMGKKWFEYAHNYFSALFYYLSELLIAKMPFKNFIAVSKYTKDKLIETGVKRNKTEVIYNGDDEDLVINEFDKDELRGKHGYSSEDYIFLSYGRAGITKGFEYLVEAIPKIFNEIPNAKFILILTKADKKIWTKITNSVKKLDKDKIFFSENVNRVKLKENLTISDCVIIPSLSEGFGFTTREAVIMGKKILATNVGSIPEVVSGDYFLIEPKSVNSIVKGCLNIYQNKFESKSHKSFSWDTTIQNYITIYKDILKEF